MGEPKAALRFGNRTILECIVDRMQPLAAEIIVVGAPLGDERFNLIRLTDEGVRVVRDEQSFQGPLAALERGLVAARQPVVFACSCDLPLLNADLAVALCAKVDAYDAMIPTVGGRPQPLHASYRREPTLAAIGRMREAGDARRLTALATRLRLRPIGEAELRRYDPELLSFTNVNTPADYARALRLAGLSPPA